MSKLCHIFSKLVWELCFIPCYISNEWIYSGHIVFTKIMVACEFNEW